MGREPEARRQEPEARRPKSPNPNFAKRTDSHLRQPKHNLARSARQFFLTERSHTPHKAPPTASARSVIFGLAIRNENPKAGAGDMGRRREPEGMGRRHGPETWAGGESPKPKAEIPQPEFRKAHR